MKKFNLILDACIIDPGDSNKIILHQKLEFEGYGPTIFTALASFAIGFDYALETAHSTQALNTPNYHGVGGRSLRLKYKIELTEVEELDGTRMEKELVVAREVLDLQGSSPSILHAKMGPELIQSFKMSLNNEILGITKPAKEEKKEAIAK